MAQVSYDVDLVLVIDATASMTPVIDSVKHSALQFHELLERELAEKQKEVNQLRVRVVVFRDLRDHGQDALAASKFFDLPQEKEAFARWVSGVGLVGGATFAESGLAGLAVAIRSDWSHGADRHRQVIVVWTDDDAHLPELERDVKPAAFADALANSFDELTDWWERSQYIDASAKRLVMFAPRGGAWSTIAENWDNAVHVESKAGAGLADFDLRELLSAIANSV